MTLPDISNLNVSELEELIRQCSSQIESRKKTKRKELAKQFKELARSEGLDVAEIIADPKTVTTRKRRGKKTSHKKAGRRKSRGKVAPKYRNPLNSSETWTGRGRKPLWVVAALDSGKKLQDLAIT
ncbi:MAG: histone-like nucleoid-structuring protein H-NS [marine bacterium B5-7]|nr:MAG: histone-like nucleoid-structuring protein H-NS [marine bacterium B5-7]